MLKQRYDRMRGAAPVDGMAILASAPISEKTYVLVGPAQR
jgi:hypothetical protein